MQATHILPLTGIRFFAAVWVVLFHFSGTLLSLFPFLKPLETFFSLGYFAVPLFFILSGFILSHNYFSSYSLKEHHKFIFLRFARLWPVHLLTFVLTIYYDGFQFGNDAFKSVTEELLMVRSWFHADLAWNFPAWSISAEWFAYIFVFPLAFLLLKRIQSLPLLLIILISFLAGAGVLPQGMILGRGGEIFFLFFSGSTLYQIRCLKEKPPAILIQTFGAVLVLGYLLFNRVLPHTIIYAGFGALIFGLSYQRGFLSRILSTKSIVFGGLASYSLYMTHAVIGQVYSLLTFGMPPQPLLIRTLLLIALVMGLGGAAFACYLFVEEPANRALRRLVNKPKQPTSGLSSTQQSAL